MAVANSSPVNPVVFFDVSIGGQVRSKKTQPCAEGKQHGARETEFTCPGIAGSGSQKGNLAQKLPTCGVW